jgi:hypothetical protein
MPVRFAAIIFTLLIGTSVFAVPMAFAAGAKMKPAEIQAAFFNGQPFTASTPSGTKFKMVFTADGKTTREPVGKAGVKGTGTWKVNNDGFCTSWTGSKGSNCYSLAPDGANKWAVMKGPSVMATWTK